MTSVQTAGNCGISISAVTLAGVASKLILSDDSESEYGEVRSTEYGVLLLVLLLVVLLLLSSTTK